MLSVSTELSLKILAELDVVSLGRVARTCTYLRDQVGLDWAWRGYCLRSGASLLPLKLFQRGSLQPHRDLVRQIVLDRVCVTLPPAVFAQPPFTSIRDELVVIYNGLLKLAPDILLHFMEAVRLEFRCPGRRMIQGPFCPPSVKRLAIIIHKIKDASDQTLPSFWSAVGILCQGDPETRFVNALTVFGLIVARFGDLDVSSRRAVLGSLASAMHSAGGCGTWQNDLIEVQVITITYFSAMEQCGAADRVWTYRAMADFKAKTTLYPKPLPGLGKVTKLEILKYFCCLSWGVRDSLLTCEPCDAFVKAWQKVQLEGPLSEAALQYPVVTELASDPWMQTVILEVYGCLASNGTPLETVYLNHMVTSDDVGDLAFVAAAERRAATYSLGLHRGADGAKARLQRAVEEDRKVEAFALVNVVPKLLSAEPQEAFRALLYVLSVADRDLASAANFGLLAFIEGGAVDLDLVRQFLTIVEKQCIYPDTFEAEEHRDDYHAFRRELGTLLKAVCDTGQEALVMTHFHDSIAAKCDTLTGSELPRALEAPLALVRYMARSISMTTPCAPLDRVLRVVMDPSKCGVEPHDTQAAYTSSLLLGSYADYIANCTDLALPAVRHNLKILMLPGMADATALSLSNICDAGGSKLVHTSALQELSVAIKLYDERVVQDGLDVTASGARIPRLIPPAKVLGDKEEARSEALASVTVPMYAWRHDYVAAQCRLIGGAEKSTALPLWLELIDPYVNDLKVLVLSQEHALDEGTDVLDVRVAVRERLYILKTIIKFAFGAGERRKTRAGTPESEWIGEIFQAVWPPVAKLMDLYMTDRGMMDELSDGVLQRTLRPLVQCGEYLDNVNTIAEKVYGVFRQHAYGSLLFLCSVAAPCLGSDLIEKFLHTTEPAVRSINYAIERDTDLAVEFFELMPELTQFLEQRGPSSNAVVCVKGALSVSIQCLDQIRGLDMPGLKGAVITFWLYLLKDLIAASPEVALQFKSFLVPMLSWAVEAHANKLGHPFMKILHHVGMTNSAYSLADARTFFEHARDLLLRTTREHLEAQIYAHFAGDQTALLYPPTSFPS